MAEVSRLRFLRGLPDRLFPEIKTARRPGIRLAIFLAWLALVVFLAANHVMWRDEVRAFSLAMQGQSILEMPVAARGYGHPLLWHVLLRLGDAVFGTKLVLPGLALAIGIAGAGILAFVARLSLPVMILTLFELLVACDKAAIRVCPLLGEYSLGVPHAVLQSLLLPFYGQMYRLAGVESCSATLPTLMKL